MRATPDPSSNGTIRSTAVAPYRPVLALSVRLRTKPGLTASAEGSESIRTDRKQATAETGNGLLDRIPSEARSALVSEAREAKLAQRENLWDVGQSVEAVYFPISGVISLLSVTKDGASVEVATVGHEGMAGIAVFLGVPAQAVGRAMCQVDSRGLLVDRDRFEGIVRRTPQFDLLLRQYTHAMLVHIGQGVVCNRMHTVVQRLARWVLEMDDKIGPDELPVTHEFLSEMMGVRRASVTDAITPLQAAGAISHERARIRLLDRHQLEELACECYGIIRRTYDRLLDAI
jgi:CRP-like cAMP-binding protein